MKIRQSTPSQTRTNHASVLGCISGRISRRLLQTTALVGFLAVPGLVAAEVITVESDIYTGIQRDYGGSDGSLTVLKGGISFADRVRAAAGVDGRLNIQELTDAVGGETTGYGTDLFNAGMAGKIAADGTFAVDDALAVLPSVDSASYLVNDVTKRLTETQVRQILTNRGVESYYLDEAIGGLKFINEDGESYLDLQNSSIGLLAAAGLADRDNDNGPGNDLYGYLAAMTDANGEIALDVFEASLPAEFRAVKAGETKTKYERDLKSRFEFFATNGKISYGDALFAVGAETDGSDYSSWSVLQAAGSDVRLTEAEFLASVPAGTAGDAKTIRTKEILFQNADPDGTVHAQKAQVLFYVLTGANDFYQDPSFLSFVTDGNGQVLSSKLQNILHRMDHDKIDVSLSDLQSYLPNNGADSTYTVEQVENALVEASYTKKSSSLVLDNNDLQQAYRNNVQFLDEGGLSTALGALAGADQTFSPSEISGLLQPYVTNGFIDSAKATELTYGLTGLAVNGEIKLSTSAAFLDAGSVVDGFRQDFPNSSSPSSTYVSNTGRVDSGYIDEIVARTFEDLRTIDPTAVRAILGAPDSMTTYSADNVQAALLQAYMEASAAAEAAAGTSLFSQLNALSSPTDGTITVDQFLTTANIFGADAAAIRPILENVAVNGKISPWDGINASQFADGLSEIAQGASGTQPVTIAKIVSRLPDTLTQAQKDSFAASLTSQADANGFVDGDAALDALVAYVIANPGTDFEQAGGAGGLVGGGIQINGGGNATLINEVDIGFNNGITVSVEGNANVTNSGEIRSEYDNGIGSFSGKTGVSSVVNSGKIYGAQNGIRASAGAGASIHNTGEIFSVNGRGLSASSGSNRTIGAEHEPSLHNSDRRDDGTGPYTGSAVSVYNSGEIQNGGISAWSNGGTVEVINDGVLETHPSYHRDGGIVASSGTNHTGNDRQEQAGGDVVVTNNGTINLGRGSAIEGYSVSGKVTGTNNGTITTSDYQAAVDLYSGSNRTESQRVVFVGGDVAFTNNGTVNAKSGAALRLGSNGGDVVLENNGAIKGAGSAAVVDLYSGTNRTENQRLNNLAAMLPSRIIVVVASYLKVFLNLLLS